MRAEALQQKIRQLVADETEPVKMWARVRLGGERMIGVAREFGYRDGSGLTHLLKKVDTQAVENKRLRRKLDELKASLSSFKS